MYSLYCRKDLIDYLAVYFDSYNTSNTAQETEGSIKTSHPLPEVSLLL